MCITTFILYLHSFFFVFIVFIVTCSTRITIPFYERGYLLLGLVLSFFALIRLSSLSYVLLYFLDKGIVFYRIYIIFLFSCYFMKGMKYLFDVVCHVSKKSYHMIGWNNYFRLPLPRESKQYSGQRSRVAILQNVGGIFLLHSPSRGTTMSSWKHFEHAILSSPLSCTGGSTVALTWTNKYVQIYSKVIKNNKIANESECECA
mmetsp:Transcript_43579/g.44262  ORF Transcript_43579/g.44262 Transcript_43579/m.44262 type:complete len:203 (+) Transcript_43579:223-831(+)